MVVPCPPPSTVRDWYQNVPQDMKFHIFNVNKKITLAKFGFLTNYVQPHDEKKKHFWNGGWGRLTLHKNLTSKPIYTYEVSS